MRSPRSGARVTFDREQDEAGRPRPTTSFLLDPETLAVFSDEADLDFAVIAVGQRSAGEAELDDLGFCPVMDDEDKHVIGMPVNIIQHPRGWPKMETLMTTETTGTDVTVVVPLEITVRVGSPSPADLGRGPQPAADRAPDKVLMRGPESIVIDTDYRNRTGYDPGFLAGHDIPLPTIASAALASQLAPLRQGEPDAESGELTYEHFSVKLNKATRIAMFTATNIDGPTYLEIVRRPGASAVPRASAGSTTAG